MAYNLSKGEKFLAPLHVLIVEDDPLMTKLLRDVLHALGFRDIHKVTDGKQALDYLKTNTVDLVLCDWLMQNMDGITFTRQIRADSLSPNRFVPILMLTGKADRKSVEKARDAGVTEYLVKPFSLHDLCGHIREAIEHPRNFIVATHYKGPDRRRRDVGAPEGKERRQQVTMLLDSV